MADRWDERNREYRGSEDRNREFNRSRDDRDRDRGLVDRAGDEVRSWFGDEEAARRRRFDEREHENRERSQEYRDAYGRDRAWSDRPQHNAAERAWDRTRDRIHDWTESDREGRRAWSEYDSSREWPRATGVVGRDDYYTRERSFGDMSRYGTAGTVGTSAWQDYRGRGPRGYNRSDERIREDICDRLTDDSRIDASDVEVQVRNGEVTLAGHVRSRDEKRFAEDLTENISGVREVNNNLKVNREDVLGTARSGSSTLGLNEAPPPGSTAPEQKGRR